MKRRVTVLLVLVCFVLIGQSLAAPHSNQEAEKQEILQNAARIMKIVMSSDSTARKRNSGTIDSLWNLPVDFSRVGRK
ncbi:uncharacterized protein LOC141912275 isoform X2 [Tubulanus polymorphus]